MLNISFPDEKEPKTKSNLPIHSTKISKFDFIKSLFSHTRLKTQNNSNKQSTELPQIHHIDRLSHIKGFSVNTKVVPASNKQHQGEHQTNYDR